MTPRHGAGPGPPEEVTTKEPQYQYGIELMRKEGAARLGLLLNWTYHDDPRRLVFVLSRYKFVSKILDGKARVLEVGCGDAFGTRIVQQAVGHVTAVDFDPAFIADATARKDEHWPMDLRVHNILDGPVAGRFDAAYSLDVLEHIPQEDEDRYVAHIIDALTDDGVLLIGTPSLHSQAHASAESKQGHINCKDAAGLKTLFSRYFENVFVFSMNDEVVHTGFHPMANYLFALCCSKRDRSGR